MQSSFHNKRILRFVAKYGVILSKDYRQKYAKHSESAAAANLMKEKESLHIVYFNIFTYSLCVCVCVCVYIILFHLNSRLIIIVI